MRKDIFKVSCSDPVQAPDTLSMHCHSASPEPARLISKEFGLALEAASGTGLTRS